MSDALKGIDVSHYQGDIDWQAVAASGVRFVYQKATDGLSGPDNTMVRNVGAAIAEGLHVGCYHFFRPALNAALQAERFAASIIQLGCNLPPVMDVEEAFVPHTQHDMWTDLTPDARIAAVSTFLARVRVILGKQPIIYTRAGYWRDTFADTDAFAMYSLWLAEYHDGGHPDTPRRIPKAWANQTLWQWNDAGMVPGIRSAVDLDLFDGSEDELTALGAII